MPVVTRRGFLEQAALIGTVAGSIAGVDGRAQGLDRFMTPAAPCEAKPTVTPAADVGGDFKPTAPNRKALAEPGMAGKPLSLTGTVIGLTCGRIKGARVDLWQADSRGIIDMAGHRLRGHQVTDAEGRYAFETIVPGASGQRAPRLHLRVEAPDPRAARGRLLTTAIFFPGDPRNAKDPIFRPELVMKTVPGAGNSGKYVFDVILDL